MSAAAVDALLKRIRLIDGIIWVGNPRKTKGNATRLTVDVSLVEPTSQYQQANYHRIAKLLPGNVNLHIRKLMTGIRGSGSDTFDIPKPKPQLSKLEQFFKDWDDAMAEDVQ